MKKILVMPGLGDIHWILLKLQDWLASRGPEWAMPEVSIWDIDNRPRSIDYFDYVPWVKKGGYFRLDLKGEDKKIFDKLYLHPGSPDFCRDFHGYDVLIGTNGNMRNGVPFTTVLNGSIPNYNYGPVGIDRSFKDFVREKYILCGFSNHGMFAGPWVKHISPDIIHGLLAAIKREFGDQYEFVFTGCEWDKPYADKVCTKNGYTNICGKTNLHQFLSLINNASAYLGYCGGNSIMAQHLDTPTVEWWSKTYFPKHDRRGWETPNAPHLVLEAEEYSHGGPTRTLILNFLREFLK